VAGIRSNSEYLAIRAESEVRRQQDYTYSKYHIGGPKELICVPPKTFLDTQIVIDVERGRISGDEWSCAVSYIKNTTRYCISPLTVGKLIYALANGDSAFFKPHRTGAISSMVNRSVTYAIQT
jgi:hypothetical protein